METREILEGNKLIAEFLGYDTSKHWWYNLKGGLPAIKAENIKYHSSWNELMPIVEKIAKKYNVRITWMPSAINVTYIERDDVFDDEIASMGGMSAIENTWYAVVNFIKWANKNPDVLVLLDKAEGETHENKN